MDMVLVVANLFEEKVVAVGDVAEGGVDDGYYFGA